MFKFRNVIILVLLGLVITSMGCVKKTITDDRVLAAVQAFVAAEPDATNEKSLTAEEKAAIKSVEVYKNTVKVFLGDDTPEALWEPIGRKVVKTFGQAERDAGMLEVAYNAELHMMATFQGKKQSFKVGDFRLENASDRVFPQLYNPRPAN
jgi:hypothetical protein